ncbi:MAG: glycosyltransferase [Xanthobacteraceae bacterium]
MISVVIPTLNSERVLVPTLAALVPGSAEGLVRDVVLADGGSRDGTAKIADAAGCEFISGPEDEGMRLQSAAASARGDWLLFLRADGILDEGWARGVGAFMAAAGRAGSANERAATFRLAVDGFGLAPRISEAAAALRLALLGRPRPDQGLLISRNFYRSLGGHAPGANSHARLLARIGRDRVIGLRTRITIAPDS